VLLRDSREPRLPKEYTKTLKSTEGVLKVIRVLIYIGTLIRLTQGHSRGLLKKTEDNT